MMWTWLERAEVVQQYLMRQGEVPRENIHLIHCKTVHSLFKCYSCSCIYFRRLKTYSIDEIAIVNICCSYLLNYLVVYLV